ncbi:MAG TPA: hypothetical protein VMS64_18405 [Candidatus Methylomirabilis sp.]|nr:hypothetical protein [Candidatus Methylomirabilis sp.]
MTARSFVGCLLVLLALIAVAEITLDASLDHAVQRHQWRAQHHATFRASQRSGPMVALDLPVRVLMAVGAVAVPDPPCDLPVLSPSVFVPPRV